MSQDLDSESRVKVMMNVKEKTRLQILHVKRHV